MRLEHIAPSLNVQDLRNQIMEVVIIPYADYQQNLFYAGMTGALSVAMLALLILGFAVLVRECRIFNAEMRA